MSEIMGRCKVLDWYAQPQPSRSAPGTEHVCVSLRVKTPDGGTRNGRVYFTPEHPNQFARYDAIRLGARLGLSERKCTARRLAAAIDLNRPEEVDASIDDKGFWRISW